MLPAGLLAAAAAAAPLARGPYLVDATSVSARVCWRAEKDACADWDGLEPGAEFRYTLPGREGSWTGHTLPAAGAPVRLAVFGDTGSGNREQARVADAIARWSPDLVLAAGDIVYPEGADADYDKRYFAPYKALLPRVPFFPSPGNHDYGNQGDANKGLFRFSEGYRRVFRRPPYYSFDAGMLHVASVDANNEGDGVPGAPSVAPGSAQRAWLEADLRASKARWKAVLLHEPLYSTGYHGGSRGLRKALETLLKDCGVDMVFQGHDHDYERTVPIGGVVYFTAGTGGAGLRAQGTTAPWSARFLREHGFLAVTLERDAAMFEFFGADAALKDSYRLLKQP